ncbi:ATP-dependent RNA helicase HrpA [Arhodomonas sp. KWT2]|uniref:ATP-dependent RNA helicase HrpA n=4 Tax=unclassified Arhodomonas TaxID=2621637 RepID=UPI0035C16F29
MSGRRRRSAAPPATGALAERVGALRTRILEAVPAPWRDALTRRLGGIERRLSRGRRPERGLKALEADVERLVRRHNARAAGTLRPDFDLDLPVIERRDDIAEAIGQHQVVVVCGETGSGKSTQLPKICLDLGRGVTGMIAHTQPRRIAARSLAARVAEECGTEVGAGVGYKIRFSDHVADGTRVKLATDGMLLAETQGDPDLADYDTIIIDEAHERSLNIDFLLGYLKNLLPRRPDLKVIITSATIDPERFSRHFGDAPIINVSGRTYPVEVRYRPLASEDEDERDRSLQQGILDAVDELARDGPGDVLVFLPSERDIRETAEALRKHHPTGTEILPLFGRLSAAEQQRVFAPHGGRRVVLATNVAETSLTVPGIRYVVDSGLVRLSRYSYRTKVQRLPIEPISQASADQRAGRCGRVAAGVCIRLYGQDDYQSRPEFTDPEILRTNLASVILQMKYLRLGDIDAFPFVEPPDPRYVRDGLRLLRELGALDDAEALTELGRRIARLPIDPRIARILLAGEDHGCLREVLILAAALSVQDPRERPMEAREAADEAHRRWQDKRSDFLAMVRLWDDFHEQARHLSQRKLRAWCREHFLSYLRMREWRDVHRQLRDLLKGGGGRENEQPADYQPLHEALLTGLVSNVALRGEDGGYTGPRGLSLAIFPGSGLARRRPKWIVAAELVETARVFARTVAEVRPEWVESVAAHLVSRQYYEPFWQERRRRVAGYEDVTLYGLPLASRRKVNFARVDPAAARGVFIAEALVRGRLDSHAPCLAHNREVIEAVEALEAKSRRRDVLVDESVLRAFYDERLPAEVVDGPSFERWVRRDGNDERLRMSREQLMEREAGEVTGADYPDHLDVNGVQLPLAYQFEPGHDDDGVTVIVPVAALNQLDADRLEWLVPGLVEEKAATLIRALPKALRKNFVPAPDFARAVLDRVPAGEGALTEVLCRELERMTGVAIPLDAWDTAELPRHLFMNVRVVDADGRVLDEGRDLAALKARLAGEASASFAGPQTADREREGLRRWEVGDLQDHVTLEQNGVTLRGYPALVDEGETVALRLLDAPEAAEHAHRAGVRRLLMLSLPDQTRHLRRALPGIDRLCLLYHRIGTCDALRADILQAVFDRVFLDDSVPRTRADFETRLREHRSELVPAAEALTATVGTVLERHHAIRKRTGGSVSLAMVNALSDIREQLDGLVYPGFVSATPADRLEDLPRYLAGIERRLDRLEREPGRDAEPHRAVRRWWERYLERRAQHERKGVNDPALAHFRWLVEEYRISQFAQDLGTRERVSERRLAEAWDEVR